MDAIQAAFSGDLESLRTQDLNVLDARGRTPLHFAVAGSRSECAAFILEKNSALLAAKDSDGCTPLHYAAAHATLVSQGKDCAKLLLAHGADMDATDNCGRAAVLLACSSGSTDVAQLFLESARAVSSLDAIGRSTAHYATQCGNSKLLGSILAREPRLAEVCDVNGASLLHVACLSGSLPCTSLLLEGRRVSPNQKDSAGAGAMHYACAGGNDAIVQLLSPALAMTIDHAGNTPLHYACRNGHAKVASLLLHMPSVLPVANVNSDTPAHLAAFGGHLECLQLFDGRLPKHVDGVDGLIHKAAFGGHARCLAFLASRYDVNARGLQGAAALHKAAYVGSEECVRMLLGAGASPVAVDDEGALPVHKACLHGKHEVAALLLQHMDLVSLSTVTDAQGCSPLHMAAASGSLECVALCLSKFKETVSGHGFAWPHYAAMSGNPRLVDMFSDQMLAVPSLDGRTPRDIAAAQGHELFCNAIAQRQSGAGAGAMRFTTVGGVGVALAGVVGGSGGGSNINGSNGVTGGAAAGAPGVLLGGSGVSDGNGGVVAVAPVLSSSSSVGADAANVEQIARAVALFNNKPAKGIQFLIHHHLVEDSPDAIARFLFETEGLSKRKIGEIISENDEASQALTNAFLRQLDFSRNDFDAAIRLFLSKFMLPGEAQKIDRVMEMFASRYFEQNPDVGFANADTCYVLAFAVVMLNTDLHSPSIKKDKKMTKQQWQNHVRGINNGNDLPLDFVNDIYEKIRTQEIKMESETNVFAGAGKKGYCMKQGGKIRTWKKRYFILNDHQLFYFKKATDEAPLGIIPLENLTVERDDKTCKFGFRLTSTDGGFIKSVRMVEGGAPKKGNHTFYVIGASSLEEQSAWIDALQQEIHRSPFYELLLAKMKK